MLEKIVYFAFAVIILCFGVLVDICINLLSKYAVDWALWLLSIIVICVFVIIMIIGFTSAFESDED